MTISTIRRLAADILGVGERKIRFAPDSVKEAEGAMTRADVKGLIEKGIIKKLPPQGRASTKRTVRRGPGHRRGPLFEQKELWMRKVRSQRKFLKMLIESGVLKKESKRNLYGKIKSGIFRNKRAFLMYLKENKFIAESYEPPKRETRVAEMKQKQVAKPKVAVQPAKPAMAPPVQKSAQTAPAAAPRMDQQPMEKKHDSRKGESA